MEKGNKEQTVVFFTLEHFLLLLVLFNTKNAVAFRENNWERFCSKLLQYTRLTYNDTHLACRKTSWSC